MIANGWIDRDFIARHTQGFDEFAEFVQACPLELVAAETKLPPAAIERFARTIHDGARVSFWWTMGVNQSHQGVRTAKAIINLALLTGNIGRPGTGANSVTGQCNAMGSRLFGNTTNLLGGRDFTNAEDRADVAGLLGLDPARIPDRNSWAYNEILEGVSVEKSAGCGSFAPTRLIRGLTRRTPSRYSAVWTFSSCRTCITRPRPHDVRI